MPIFCSDFSPGAGTTELLKCVLSRKLEGLLLLQHQLSLEVPQAIQLITAARLFSAPPDGVGPHRL